MCLGVRGQNSMYALDRESLGKYDKNISWIWDCFVICCFYLLFFFENNVMRYEFQQCSKFRRRKYCLFKL